MTGFHKIPTKLVKVSAELLCTPVSVAINNSLKCGVFPDQYRQSSIYPGNFRPTNISQNTLNKKMFLFLFFFV